MRPLNPKKAECILKTDLRGDTSAWITHLKKGQFKIHYNEYRMKLTFLERNNAVVKNGKRVPGEYYLGYKILRMKFNAKEGVIHGWHQFFTKERLKLVHQFTGVNLALVERRFLEPDSVNSLFEVAKEGIWLYHQVAAGDYWGMYFGDKTPRFAPI